MNRLRALTRVLTLAGAMVLVATALFAQRGKPSGPPHDGPGRPPDAARPRRADGPPPTGQLPPRDGGQKPRPKQPAPKKR